MPLCSLILLSFIIKFALLIISFTLNNMEYFFSHPTKYLFTLHSEKIQLIAFNINICKYFDVSQEIYENFNMRKQSNCSVRY